MQHVRFGRTGLKVSRLCLGTMTFGYQCDAATSFAIMDAAAEAGITFLDTADVYPLGAPADVFASASPKNLKQVVDAGGASASTNFAKNFMKIAVPPSNPAGITGVADLAKKGVTLALCQPQVPCGKAAAQVFSNAKISVHPVTLEANVKSTLTKVELNEVDAGIVYVTDVKAAGSKVKGIVIPADIDASTEYPIAALTKARNSAGAQAFVAYVLSPAGQAVLAAAGFEKP